MKLFSFLRSLPALYREYRPPDSLPSRPSCREERATLSDETGSYRERQGIVLSIDDGSIEWGVDVEIASDDTPLRTYRHRVYWRGTKPPPVGAVATIRLYDWGGGWYPDDILVSWTVPSSMSN